MISIQNITKIFPPNTIALENISFEIEKGEFLIVAGRSGAGKTTLLKLILAEEKPTKGRIFFEKDDIHKIKKNKLPYFRRKIGAVFQDYKLLSTKKVKENVAYVLEVIGKEEKEIQDNVSKVLELVGLSHRSENFPNEISAGERQRTAIARALIHRPEVILADEPTGNLDPYNTTEIIEILLKINSLGATVVLATHNKEIIQSLKKRIIILQDGKLIRDDKEGKFIL